MPRMRNGQEFMWELPQWASDKFDQLVREITQDNLDEADPDTSDRFWAILGQMKALPGFPRHAGQYKLIRRRVTTATTVH